MTSMSVLDELSIRSGSYTWINIDRLDPDLLSRLKTEYSFHDLDIEDCLSKTQIPKIDEYGDYLFIILHFPRYLKEKRYSVPIQLSIFLGRDFLATVHNGELKPLNNLFAVYRSTGQVVDAGRNEKAACCLTASSPSSLLYTIIYTLVENLLVMGSKILRAMEDIEDIVFDEHISAAREVTGLRHNIANFRRSVLPLKRVIYELEKKIGRFTGEDMGNYFGDLTDYIEKVWAIAEECREAIEIYKDTDVIISSNRTNKILTVLTILFTLSIPFTLFGTLYGMNVALPGGIDRPWTLIGPYSTFMLIILASIAPAICMFKIFRKLKWF
jgi:magnesium transporter